ncbi:hypothetical protein HanXRQr2_Chr09g0401551 [Helianthus annuus]|uniref:Uncharacterized protein n=1 Tax=Helianthus annuus TaxID=4232 RepID=A0A9K3I844_HELAN|nr:hypothetical protein HanXRQr2_Chr09g0401551 [Helianthus annuus]KAJ0894287.1 hypothetical protein HanPSC8_Chr09g0387351 [Helianthus annuus]
MFYTHLITESSFIYFLIFLWFFLGPGTSNLPTEQPHLARKTRTARPLIGANFLSSASNSLW